MEKIFVSYGRKDLDQVQQIVRELGDLGVDFWMDTRNLKSGDLWTQEITKGIKVCRAFLLFMSRDSMSSDNVRREVQLAFELKKKIHLLKLDNAPIPDELQFLITGIQWIDFSNKDWKPQLSLALGRTLAETVSEKQNIDHLFTAKELTRESNTVNFEAEFISDNSVQKERKQKADTVTISEHVPQNYFEQFLAKFEYLSVFEGKINQSISNSTPLIKAEYEFNELAVIANKLESEFKIFGNKHNLSVSDIKRIEELARSIANQTHSAAAVIATSGTPVKQINQIKQNLPTLVRLIRQLVANLQK